MSDVWRFVKYALFLYVASTLLFVVIGQFGAFGGAELMIGLALVAIMAAFLFHRMLRRRGTSARRSSPEWECWEGSLTVAHLAAAHGHGVYALKEFLRRDRL